MFLSKQDEQIEHFDVSSFWSGLEEMTTTHSSTIVIMEALYQTNADV